MYRILHFSGGVHKFDILAEHVDDVGGLIFQENHLHISRGNYFLSEEIQVIFMVPPNELASIQDLAREIKGEIQEIEVEEPLKSNLHHIMDVHNILCKSGEWVNLENILKSFESCQEDLLESETDVLIFADLEELQECIELMLSLELVEKRKIKGEVEYRSKI
jgi:methyl coenzyme M reductase subunit C-like uncharacterized protein (methanogenesis marker protein 7)